MKANRWIMSVFYLLITFTLTVSALPMENGYSALEDAVSTEAGPFLFTHRGEVKIEDLHELYSNFGSPLEGEYVIVQFDGPITNEMKRSLASQGMNVLDYLPDFSFVVKLNGRNPSILEGISSVHGWTYVPDEMKISKILLDDLEYDSLIVETFIHSGDAYRDLRMRSAGVEIVSEKRYEVSMPVTSIEDIAGIEDVKWIEPKPEMVLHNNEADDILDITTIRTTYGLDGTGQIVAIGDSGIDTGVDNHSVDGDMHLDFDNRVIIRDWVGDGPEDLHGHGTHVSGSVAGGGDRSNGNIRGMAPNASIVFQALGPGSQNSIVSPSNLSTLFKQAYDLGARIHTNSWGASGSSFWGRYTSQSYDADWTQFYYPDMLILFAAGNDGQDASSPFGKIDPGQVSPPATAKSIVTVGASENDRPSIGVSWNSFVIASNPIASDRVADNPGGLAGFSSRGPTDDDRIKPDVVAPGTYILSTKSSVGASSGWASYDQYYHYNGGTSMATPITTGTATVIRQFYNDTIGLSNPLNSLLKATLLNGAVDLNPGQYGTGAIQEVNARPDIDQGWGRVNLKGSIYPDTGNFDFENNVEGLRTGENFSRVFRVNSPEELRLTLAWSDFPGSLFAGKYLVNDLDLRLTAPNGTVYHGNDLTAPFDDTRDDLNPVESITIPSPGIGWWKVEVNASNVPRGPQHFAVVMSGNTTDMITNSLLFDRHFYSTDNARITIRLTDAALVGNGVMDINLTTTSDPIGRTITLSEEGEYGTFVGSIFTSNTSTADPGRVHVSAEDTIYAMFLNDGTGKLFEATATAKTPQRVSLYYLPENHVIYSEGDIIRLKGRGDIGANAQWGVPGSSLGWQKLYDDGDPLNGDETAGDGIYNSLFLVPDGTLVNGTLVVRVLDPFLDIIDYPQFPLRVNHSMPRIPRNLHTRALPQGNSIELGWTRSAEADVDHHAIFMNASGRTPAWDLDSWEFLFETIDKRNTSEISGLVDGVEYFFRVATINSTGEMSSLSPWVSGIPMDSLAPSLVLVDAPAVLAGDARIQFSVDDDLRFLEMEYYNDTDNNKTADDGNQWRPAAVSRNGTVIWNTREEAGGPGNLGHMILRARGSDEVNNTGQWMEFSGFAVDNIGPVDLYFDTYPPRISSTSSYRDLLGVTEPLSFIELYVNGILKNTTIAGSQGIFNIDLELEEGYNLVNLTGYDRYGAGPVVVPYEFTVDTMLPSAVILDTFQNIEISREGIDLASNSTDKGFDPEFTLISNITWEIILPTGEIRRGYDPVYHLNMDQIGNHAATLRVKDMAGNTNSTTFAFYVKDTTDPEPYVVGPMVVKEDTTVRYSSFGTTDNDPLFLTSRDTFYNWTFYDNKGWTSTSENNETLVVFPEPGTYFGELEVVDRSGNSGNITFTVKVLDITPPTGSITARTWIYIDESAYFNATFTDNDLTVFENATYSWRISFLDDQGRTFFIGTESGWSLKLDFDDVGNYTLVVNVTDPGGNWVEEEHTIWVKERPGEPVDVGMTRDERSWTFVIIIGVLMAIVLIAALLFLYIKTREKISDVDWADDEEFDDDEDLEDDDDWEWDDD